MCIDSVCGVNINQAYRNLQPLVKQLLELNCTKDEIVSDIYTTILICKKDFKAGPKTNFYKYLYTAFKNNFNRKIFALRTRFASECQVNESILAKEKSPIEEALFEVPETQDFLSGKINLEEFAQHCTEANIRFSDVLEGIDDWVTNYLPQ